MNHRLLLGAWLAAVVGITFIHDPVWLAGLLALVLVLAGREAPALIRAALVAVVVVNLAVSLGYAASAAVRGEPWLAFVARLNLRVVLIAVLTLWLARHLDPVRATSFSRPLQFLVVLALGQIQAFCRLVQDYRLAFVSRTPVRPPLADRFRGTGRQAAALMEKAELQASELNQGMRARGYFDERQ